MSRELFALGVLELAEAAAQSWADRWLSFAIVFGASLFGAALVVATYAFGLRLLAAAGKVPVVVPAAYTGQIAIIDEEVLKQRRKDAKRARKRPPLGPVARRWALVGAYACFTLAALAVLLGIYLIVPALHH